MMKITKSSLHNEAVARIRDLIVEGKLEPGSKVPEKQLCESFGISRTPLREALKVLASEGLLVLQPNRGARVAVMTANELKDLFQVMASLEGLAGELACANIDDAALSEIQAQHFQMMAHYSRGDRVGYFRANQAIHEAIIAAARNTVLSALYDSLRGRVRPARFMANLTRERWDEAVREHREILDALTRRDGPRLREILQQHLEHKHYELVASGSPVSAPDTRAGARTGARSSRQRAASR
jgi:DNA-binding GntR family transcriptional regulator